VSIKDPAYFDPPGQHGIMGEWLTSLRSFSVQALVVLGPDPFAGQEARLVLAVHPPHLLNAAHALAASEEFGVPWQNSDAPLVAWQDISRSALVDTSPWRQLWRAQGFQSIVRIAFPLPAARAFECYLFSLHLWLDRTEPMEVAWSAFNIWPVLKRSLAQSRNPLTERELECLGLAFEGLTARKTSDALKCSERTVNFHLANAMGKLHVDNKLAAVQRACWFGLI
jgi:LuxR family quorum-sensing system transcriptional regulator SolR